MYHSTSYHYVIIPQTTHYNLKVEVSQPLNNLNASQIILGASSHRELYLCLPLGGQNTHEQYEHSNK